MEPQKEYKRYELTDICRLFSIKKKDFLELIKQLPEKHSRQQVVALLLKTHTKRIRPPKKAKKIKKPPVK